MSDYFNILWTAIEYIFFYVDYEAKNSFLTPRRPWFHALLAEVSSGGESFETPATGPFCWTAKMPCSI